MRTSQTTRYQVGPTLRRDWQVLDIRTGVSALVSNLQLDSMSRDEALELPALLNDLEMETLDTQLAEIGLI